MSVPEVHVDSAGNRHYWLNGKLHRDDGPAIVFASGKHFWYLNGDSYYDRRKYQADANLSDEDMVALLLRYRFK